MPYVLPSPEYILVSCIPTDDPDVPRVPRNRAMVQLLLKLMGCATTFCWTSFSEQNHPSYIDSSDIYQCITDVEAQQTLFQAFCEQPRTQFVQLDDDTLGQVPCLPWEGQPASVLVVFKDAKSFLHYAFPPTKTWQHPILSRLKDDVTRMALTEVKNYRTWKKQLQQRNHVTAFNNLCVGQKKLRYCNPTQILLKYYRLHNGIKGCGRALYFPPSVFRTYAQRYNVPEDQVVFIMINDQDTYDALQDIQPQTHRLLALREPVLTLICQNMIPVVLWHEKASGVAVHPTLWEFHFQGDCDGDRVSIHISPLSPTRDTPGSYHHIPFFCMDVRSWISEVEYQAIAQGLQLLQDDVLCRYFDIPFSAAPSVNTAPSEPHWNARLTLYLQRFLQKPEEVGYDKFQVLMRLFFMETFTSELPPMVTLRTAIISHLQKYQEASAHMQRTVFRKYPTATEQETNKELNLVLYTLYKLEDTDLHGCGLCGTLIPSLHQDLREQYHHMLYDLQQKELLASLLNEVFDKTIGLRVILIKQHQVGRRGKKQNCAFSVTHVCLWLFLFCFL